jgi:hypothetical protein
MEDIEAGLKALHREIQNLGVKSIAIPPLGAGLGGLDWQEVRSRTEASVASLPMLKVYIYEPNGAPELVKIIGWHTMKEQLQRLWP